jgi:uncharacterized protein DUF955
MASSATSGRMWEEPLVKRLIQKHGVSNPEWIIERYANKLRVEAGQNELPIRPDLIASVQGIRLRRGRHDFAGRIYVEENGQLVMDINERDSPERQHFTEAHELIHTAFPGFKREHRYRSDAVAMERHPPNREEEYLCDFGAAALLMPSDLVRDRYTVGGGLRDAERLASDADVSVEAAANRLIAVSDEPAVLLCLVRMHKPADRPALRRGVEIPERLRIRYGFSRHIDLYVPRFKSADDDSLLVRAANSFRLRRGIETLPGVETAGLFRLEAKSYGTGPRERVLAIARPTA